MGQVIVRNLDDDVVAALKSRAARKGHSLEQELRDILSTAAASDRKQFMRRLADFRTTLGNRVFPDAAELIREDRDR